MNDQGLTFPGLDTTIREVQLVERDILFAIDELCRKHDIKYVLFAGTLLGAVRHGGFIPWDDDVDICMLREEYDRFLKIARQELDPKYILSNYADESGSILLFTKVRRRDSKMVQQAYKDDPICHGIFVDIFPMDNVKPNTSEGLAQEKEADRLFVLTSSLSKSRCNYTASQATRLARHLLRLGLTMMSQKKLYAKAERVFRRFNQEPTEYVATLTNGMPPREMDRFKMTRSEMTDLIEIPFEGKPLWAPKDYDAVLQRAYGDYMAFPPEKDRIPLHNILAIELPQSE